MAQCKLCPRNCGADRENGEIGYCGCPADAVVAHVMLHKWEEPCISGENGSGAVFFAGCQLKCVYCQNAGISRSCVGKLKTPAELADVFLALQRQNAENINLVTPDPYIPKIIKAVSLAKERGLAIPVVFNCSGYMYAETVGILSATVNVYLTDFKYSDDSLALRYSACGDYTEKVKNALEAMVRQKPTPVFNEKGIMTSGVIVRCLLLPGHSDDAIKSVEYIYGTYGDSVYISIMNQFTPVGLENHPELNRRVTTLEYDRVVNRAIALGVKNAYTQKSGTALESFIPEFKP